MVESNLKTYVERLFKQGYGKDAVRNSLLNAGYSPNVVEEAITAALPQKKISTKLLLIIFFILLGGALTTLLILKLLQEPPAVLSQTTELYSTEIKPGEELLVTTIITNPSQVHTTGLIDYTITGPEGTIATATEQFNVRDSVSIPKSIKLPDNILPGDYSVKSTVSYLNTQITQSANFKITEKAQQIIPIEIVQEQPIQEAEQEQKTCPIKCDDFNFCTQDSCINGKCEYTQITPCCGNAKCETGENTRNCALDCSEKPPSPDDINNQAAQLAKTDIENAMKTCDILSQQAYIDTCLLKAAEASASKTPCKYIGSNDLRDSCYIPFAYNNDFSVCEKISNPSTRNTCFTLQQISQIKEQIPKDQLEKAELELKNIN